MLSQMYVLGTQVELLKNGDCATQTFVLLSERENVSLSIINPASAATKFFGSLKMTRQKREGKGFFEGEEENGWFSNTFFLSLIATHSFVPRKKKLPTIAICSVIVFEVGQFFP